MLVHIKNTPHFIEEKIVVFLTPGSLLCCFLAFFRRCNQRPRNTNAAEHFDFDSRILNSSFQTFEIFRFRDFALGND